MGIFDYLIPETMEHQRALARQRFQSSVAQPQMFNMENIPLSQLMIQDYEKGFGIPYPTRQMPSPTAGLQGMTFDPNRGNQVVQPENLPIEYVQPRTAEDIALRQAGMMGKAAGEQKLSEYGQMASGYPGLRSMVSESMDDENIDLPGTLGFERPEVGKSQESWGPIQYDKYGHAYSIEETTKEPKGLWGKPTEGAGEKNQEYEYYAKVRDDAGKSIDRFMTKIDPFKLYMIKQLGLNATQDPEIISSIQGKLSPTEQIEIREMMRQISWANEKISKLTAGANQDPFNIRK